MEPRNRVKSLSWIPGSKRNSIPDNLTFTKGSPPSTGQRIEERVRPSQNECKLITMSMGLAKSRLCRKNLPQWYSNRTRSWMSEESKTESGDSKQIHPFDELGQTESTEPICEESSLSQNETEFFWLKGFNLYEAVQPCSQSTRFFFSLAQSRLQQTKPAVVPTKIWTHQRDPTSMQIRVIRPATQGEPSRKHPVQQPPEKHRKRNTHPPTIAFPSASNAQLHCVTVDECPKERSPKWNAHLARTVDEEYSDRTMKNIESMRERDSTSGSSQRQTENIWRSFTTTQKNEQCQ
ncbi:hypothetical protein D915_005827 [Fasciola hepatica]|uniref:Uncharacterized protein n=1 Tax=Fasciola hepatica TaxID=6192 RepID=A0A4E0R3K4_FASHE|nr:hypothetical protein D915_005827 [Fasciola hepatica]